MSFFSGVICGLTHLLALLCDIFCSLWRVAGPAFSTFSSLQYPAAGLTTSPPWIWSFSPRGSIFWLDAPYIVAAAVLTLLVAEAPITGDAPLCPSGVDRLDLLGATEAVSLLIEVGRTRWAVLAISVHAWISSSFSFPTEPPVLPPSVSTNDWRISNNLQDRLLIFSTATVSFPVPLHFSRAASRSRKGWFNNPFSPYWQTH